MNGAQAENIIWAVASEVTVGACAHMKGILLAKMTVELMTGSSLNSGIFAQTAVTLQMATVTQKPE